MARESAKNEFERRHRQLGAVRKVVSMLERDLPGDGDAAREVLAMLAEMFQPKRDPADGTSGEKT